jgi:hypothetical protein
MILRFAPSIGTSCSWFPLFPADPTISEREFGDQMIGKDKGDRVLVRIDERLN